MKVTSILIILIVAVVCCTVNVESADWPQPNGGSYYSAGKRRHYGPQFEARYRAWRRWLKTLGPWNDWGNKGPDGKMMRVRNTARNSVSEVP